MKDEYYFKVLKQNLERAEVKLLALQQEADQMKNQWGEKHFRYIMALEKVSIAHENIIEQRYFLENGVSRNPIQSIAVPKEFQQFL